MTSGPLLTTEGRWPATEGPWPTLARPWPPAARPRPTAADPWPTIARAAGTRHPVALRLAEPRHLALGPVHRGPVAELRAFLHAALLRPVDRDHAEPPGRVRRRRVVALITLLAGAGILAAALRITPGDPAFYGATLALAAVWTVGALASGPLHLGRAHTRAGAQDARPVVQSLALGGLLVALFLAGAVLVSRVPALVREVDAVLDHARLGSTALILIVVVVNGIAEELYFRGALYAAVGRHAVPITTVLYALTTAGTGNPMLVLAAAFLGVLTGLQRRVTGGVLGPILTHIVWSSAMVFLLPPVLEALS